MMMYPPAEGGGHANTWSVQAGHRRGGGHTSTLPKWKTRGYGRDKSMLINVHVELPPGWCERGVKKRIGGIFGGTFDGLF